MKRVYVLEYKIHVNLYSFDEPKMENRTEYYGREERDEFISEFLRLSDKDYISDMKTYFAKLDEVDMDSIINAI